MKKYIEMIIQVKLNTNIEFTVNLLKRQVGLKHRISIKIEASWHFILSFPHIRMDNRLFFQKCTLWKLKNNTKLKTVQKQYRT